MQLRNIVAFAFIGALVVANVFYWGSHVRVRSGQRAPGVTPRDFRLAVLMPKSSVQTMHRDPFVLNERVFRRAVVARPVLPPPAPVLTARQLASKSALADLARLKCIGVVFRKRGPEAFLLMGHRAYVATVGATVDDRFRVEGITLDSVSLQDRESDMTGQLPVTGN